MGSGGRTVRRWVDRCGRRRGCSCCAGATLRARGGADRSRGFSARTLPLLSRAVALSVAHRPASIQVYGHCFLTLFAVWCFVGLRHGARWGARRCGPPETARSPLCSSLAAFSLRPPDLECFDGLAVLLSPRDLLRRLSAERPQSCDWHAACRTSPRSRRASTLRSRTCASGSSRSRLSSSTRSMVSLSPRVFRTDDNGFGGPFLVSRGCVSRDKESSRVVGRASGYVLPVGEGDVGVHLKREPSQKAEGDYTFAGLHKMGGGDGSALCSVDLMLQSALAPNSVPCFRLLASSPLNVSSAFAPFSQAWWVVRGRR